MDLTIKGLGRRPNTLSITRKYLYTTEAPRFVKLDDYILGGWEAPVIQVAHHSLETDFLH